MPHQEPPRCSSEQRKTNKTKEHPDYDLANFHGDEQRNDTTQHNGGFQGWREFGHCALCDQVHFFRACGPNDWTAAGPSSQRIESEKGMAWHHKGFLPEMTRRRITTTAITRRT